MTRIAELDERYRRKIARINTFAHPRQTPVASVVVVLYQTNRQAFQRTLSGLETQQFRPANEFEIVVVDNGTDWDVRTLLNEESWGGSYVELAGNHGVTVARNVGARLARTGLLVFLDDDAVPAPRFVGEHVSAHREFDIVAARGKIEPRSTTIFNRLQDHYDLSDDPRPYFINTEGNASFDRETFLEYGGFDEAMDGRAGHEGIVLSYRMISNGIDRDAIIYYPEAVIYHDFASSLSDFAKKERQHERATEYLETHYPEISEFIKTYATENADQRLLATLARDTVSKLARGYLTASDVIRGVSHNDH